MASLHTHEAISDLDFDLGGRLADPSLHMQRFVAADGTGRGDKQKRYNAVAAGGGSVSRIWDVVPRLE